MSELDPSVVTVVGIGLGGWAELSAASRAAVAAATVLFGSARQLELIPTDIAPDAPRVQWPSPLRPALAGLLADHAGRRCVLASGDPMFFGIGTTLVEMLGAQAVRVLPAVSSVSLAAARLGWALDDLAVLSVVGRPVAGIARRFADGRRLLILSADATSVPAVAGLLAERGYGASRLTVLENLGGPSEQCVRGTAATWSAEVAPLNVIAVECAANDPDRYGTGFGLPDSAFEHDGQLTKQDVRAVTMARLAPRPGELLWDIGSGSGSIAIEWLLSDPSCRAVAIERDATRVTRIAGNAERLGAPGLQVVAGAAPAALRELPVPDAVFIGGGLTAAGVFDAAWRSLRSGGRLVANGVTVESEALLAKLFSDHGGDLRRISISHSSPVGSFTGWRSAMPVTQWQVRKP